jgi:hypothetical protein
MQSPDFSRITKKYIIDCLDLMFFEETCTWNGMDMFNELPILSTEIQEPSDMEFRGCYLVHKRIPHGLRVLIARSNVSTIKVCYRICDITKTMIFSDPNKVVYPYNLAPIDFCLSDQNLGAFQPSSLTFANLNTVNFESSVQQLLNLSSFILSSALVFNQDSSCFASLLEDPYSEPPLVNDKHFIPIFGASQQEESYGA